MPRLQSAVAARDYASQNLDAEQKKYSLGASTSTLVLQASSALTQAESNVLAAATNYEKSRVQLDLFTADTLAKLGIDMSEAESGKVQKMPTVPGAIPATDSDSAAAASPSSSHQNWSSRACRPQGRHVFCFRPCRREGSMEALSLSVVIITLNEEANLARTLASVAWADEIVVLDSGSTDRTREVAESFHAKFFVEPWKGFAAQKNSALGQSYG